MAHFAEVISDNNTVLRVIVVGDDVVQSTGGNLSVKTEEWCTSNIPNNPSFEGEYPQTYWKQTFKDNSHRKKYAAIGDIYDAAKDKFITPQSFASWTLDANDDWQPPITKPKQYVGADPLAENVVIEDSWDEDNQRWNGIQPETDVNYVWSTINNEWEGV